jgi:hypothetical protein
VRRAKCLTVESVEDRSIHPLRPKEAVLRRRCLWNGSEIAVELRLDCLHAHTEAGAGPWPERATRVCGCHIKWLNMS